MAQVLTDVFLMESYVNERVRAVSQDSLTVLKQSFYPSILKHHQVDSLAFYSTLNYFQAHPKDFTELLAVVDSNLAKIQPKDTATFISADQEPPKEVDKLLNFRGTPDELKKMYPKEQQTLRKIKSKETEKYE